MNHEHLRLECLKLAQEWGMMRFRQGFSGISLDDVTEKARELYAFCTGYSDYKPVGERIDGIFEEVIGHGN